jgi:signal transduction histidine kinase
VSWRRVSRWFQVNSLAPAWIPPRWRHPLVGYVLASVLTLLTITLEFAVFHVWLQMESVAGLFVFLLVLFVGLNLGAGPCLVSTVLGTFLLYYVVYPPQFSTTLKYVVDIVSDGVVLFGGLFVTYIATQRERERREAERERQRMQGALETLQAMVEALVQPPAPADGVGSAAATDRRIGEDLIGQRLAEVLAYTLECQQVSLHALEAETGALALLGNARRSPDQAQPWEEATHTRQLPSSVWQDTEVLERLHAGEIVRIEGREPQLPSEPGGPRSLASQRVPLLAIPLQRGATLLGVVTLEASGRLAHAPSEHLDQAPAIAHLGTLVLEWDRLVLEREVARAESLAQHKAKQQLARLLEIVSHELKTPLMGLLLGLQVVQQRLDRLVAHPTTPTAPPAAATATEAWAEADVGVGADGDLLASVQQHLRRVYRQGKRLERLVNELLESSRIETGHFELRRERTDLAPLVVATIEEVRALVPERTIDLHPLPAQPILVEADSERLGHVVTNYLSNALKYSAEGRPITVEVQVDDEAARVAVTDEGPGLPSSEQERIWQRFYRVQDIEVQSGSGVGFGLGLYLCKSIIERHGGQVSVESVEGQGSTFWFTLPLAGTP